MFAMIGRPQDDAAARAKRLLATQDALDAFGFCVPAIQSDPLTASMTFDRVTFDPNMMGGRACIRGMRITVALVVNLIANGMSPEEIMLEYPDLEEEDIRQSLRYAAWLAEDAVQELDAA